jgi:hypothetical protein
MSARVIDAPGKITPCLERLIQHWRERRVAVLQPHPPNSLDGVGDVYAMSKEAFERLLPDSHARNAHGWAHCSGERPLQSPARLSSASSPAHPKLDRHGQNPKPACGKSSRKLGDFVRQA